MGASPWKIGSVIVVDSEEHEVLGYKCNNSYVVLRRSVMTVEVTRAVKYCQSHITAKDAGTWTFEKAAAR